MVTLLADKLYDEPIDDDSSSLEVESGNEKEGTINYCSLSRRYSYTIHDPCY